MVKNKDAVKGKANMVSRAQVRNMIKQSIAASVELKRYVVAFTGQTTSTTGTVSPITQGIVQGDSILMRDGDQAIVKKVIVRYNLAFNSGGSATTQRVIIFWDNQANGASPVVTDVLNSASFITGYNPVITQTGRFHILHDELIPTCINASNAAVDRVWAFKLNHRVTYLDTTNVATANGKGAMFVLFIADSTSSLYAASYEVHFTDA